MRCPQHAFSLLRRTFPDTQTTRLSRRYCKIEVHALRERRGVTQTALAQALEVSRPRVSRIEHDGEDVRISTMQRYVEALGGQLKLFAVFEDGEEIALRT